MSNNVGIDRMAVAARIRARRRELGLTQYRVSVRMGYPNYNRLCVVEAIGQIPTGPRLHKLAAALETTPEYLLTGVAP